MTHYIPGVGYVSGAFVTPDGTQYPSNWLRLATPEDMAALGAVPQPTPGPGEVVEQGPDGWIVRAKTAEEVEEEAEAARRAVAAQVNAERDRRLAEGAPYAGKRIDVGDKGRADLSGMAVTAVAAASGSLPWPDSYTLGWITSDNTRLPLPTAADGLALAAAVGDWYARTIQYARDLKDAALAGETIDITTGWPE